MNKESKVIQCHLCNEYCPQAEMAKDIASGRMYATNELIKCQKELEAYRAIGTVEECREAVEKMKPKKPTHKTTVLDATVFVGYIGNCPNCGCIVDEDDTCCSFCYQALDWGE